MEFTKFVRTPFQVEAVEITEENIAEVAKLIGVLCVKTKETYIAVDRRIVPTVSKAGVGWFVTRMGESYRCYSPKVFTDQFVPRHDEMTWTFEIDAEDAYTAALAEVTPDPIYLEVYGTD